MNRDVRERGLRRESIRDQEFMRGEDRGELGGIEGRRRFFFSNKKVG
jgi:hypothetical protein